MNVIGFGFMEGGSVTLEPCKGNPKPWFHRLPATKSLVVHAGLANDGVEAITARLQHYYKLHQLIDFPLNISVAKTNSPHTCSDSEAIADYIGSLRHIRRSAVGNMVTLNISCPNTYGGEPFTTPDRLEQLLAAVDHLHLQQPVFIKMPSHLSWKQFNELLRVIARHHVDGVTIGNLMKDRSRVALKDPLPDHIKGGLSGKPTQKATNALIRKTRQIYGKRFVIIGVGGIFTAEDAYEKIQLGADLVELITGMIFEGPQRIGQINAGLVQLLHQDGYRHISEAVGTKVL
jgi:dihydroorotate dehydrogenase (fumarate)